LIIATSNDHYEESDYGLFAYADSLIRLVHAGDGYQLRLDKATTNEELTALIYELEQMLLPLPYQRTPYTVAEIGYCSKFLADKDDYYERHITSSIR
jgi:hypothetical protein